MVPHKYFNWYRLNLFKTNTQSKTNYITLNSGEFNMEKEQKLYDSFVNILTRKLEEGPTPKELEIVMNFLKNNNIQATLKHSNLNELKEKTVSLPFEDDDELPLKRVK